MRIYPVAFAGISLMVVCDISRPVEALPFHRNCASMQSYLNSKPWKTPTRLSGMENSQMLQSRWANGEEMISCDGYITESSPMGTKVCQGKVVYADPKGMTNSMMVLLYGSANPTYAWSATSNASCRWR